jgi:formate hydrogenlyase transcriptional activator
MSAVTVSSPLKVSAKRDLIGVSHGMHDILAAIQLVAQTDSTVLIQGETGTGKELVASAIHDESHRRHSPYIKMNCAAIPVGLLESELFGHERGAFTGALMQTTGRFQRAHKGTLFLDEIGDLPLALQPKILRALQEQEIERIGNGRPIPLDVRIVAATNQDLAKMVRERRFRADLFYRLNVFPIRLPARRERPEDIPVLVRHFVDEFSTRMGKCINVVPDCVVQALQAYEWPGNIRELQNVIERAVIMTRGLELILPPGSLETTSNGEAPPTIRTLAEAERDHIVQALRAVRWVVGGKNGAAARLGLPRTTLLAKMQKLGILAPEANQPKLLPHLA